MITIKHNNYILVGKSIHYDTWNIVLHSVEKTCYNKTTDIVRTKLSRIIHRQTTMGIALPIYENVANNPHYLELA